MNSNISPRIYTEITRVNVEERTIECYGTRGDIKDSFGTFIDLDSAVKCMSDYAVYPAIRSMHQPIAAGKTIDYEVDDKGIKITAKVVDDDCWNKVKEGVLRGLSIGAKQDYTVRAGKNIGRIKPEKWQENDIIHLASITEFSLVDSPSNRGCGDLVYRLSNYKESDMEKFSEATDITRYAGEEINDTQSACYALSQIQSLLNKEKGESAEPAGAEQIASLTAAIVALKAFITSEIQEDTSTEPARDSNYYWAAVADLCRAEETKADSITRLSALGFAPFTAGEMILPVSVSETLRAAIADSLSDGAEVVINVNEVDTARVQSFIAEHGDVIRQAFTDVTRKGKTISAKNGEKVQAIHDHACDMGAVCRCNDVKKADGEGDDIQRLATLETDLTRLSGELDTLRSENGTLVERVKTLEAEPAPPKAALLAVDRGDDIGGKGEKVKRIEDTEEYQKADGVTRANMLMKQTLGKPINVYRNVN